MGLDCLKALLNPMAAIYLSPDKHGPYLRGRVRCMGKWSRAVIYDRFNLF